MAREPLLHSSFSVDSCSVPALPRSFAFRQTLFLQAGAHGDWPLISVATLDNPFGPGFAKALEELPLGARPGSARSVYGWHTVRVEEKWQPMRTRIEVVREVVAKQREYYALL